MTLDKLESLAIVSTAYSMHAAFISGLGFSSDVGLKEKMRYKLQPRWWRAALNLRAWQPLQDLFCAFFKR